MADERSAFGWSHGLTSLTQFISNQTMAGNAGSRGTNQILTYSLYFYLLFFVHRPLHR